MSQLHLLTERRFCQLFWTQFLGAFNDNLFKNALVILIAYRSMTLLGISSATIVVACAGIFIFPFFLFSATAGQLADHYPKGILMRWVKVWEIGVMVLAGIGFATDSLARLFTLPVPALGLARSAGMLAFDLLPPAKRWLTRMTMGRAGRTPKLARGLPL